MVRGRARELTKRENLQQDENDDFTTKNVIQESYKEDSYSSGDASNIYEGKREEDMMEDEDDIIENHLNSSRDIPELNETESPIKRIGYGYKIKHEDQLEEET